MTTAGGKRHAKRERTAHEKQQGGQRSHAHVEASLEILVCRVTSRVKNGTTVTDRMIIASGRPVELNEPEAGQLPGRSRLS